MEVLHKMTVQADLLTNFCECYDLKPHATNIFQDIVNSLGAYVHSLFVNPQMMNQTGTSMYMYIIHLIHFLIIKRNLMILEILVAIFLISCFILKTLIAKYSFVVVLLIWNTV